MELKNKKFGKLTVVDLAPKTKNRSIRWLCKCDCGNEKIVRQKNLIEGIVTDCGCESNNLDLTNKVYGRLKVLKLKDHSKSKIWECLCECGIFCEVKETYLKSGYAKSCGCLKNELNKKGNPKHNLNNSRIYKIYYSMKQRCYLKTHMYYKNYGGRGITVCDEWLGDNGFVNFYEWSMENGYNNNLTIDRIDNNGKYEPNNCRWTTKKHQQNNTRKTKIYNYKGENLTTTEICEKYNINKSTFNHRIAKYGDVNIAIEKPINSSKKRY